MRIKLIAVTALSAFLLPSAPAATQRSVQPRQRKQQVKPQPAPAPAATPERVRQLADLSLEVGLVTRSGDVKKIPRTEFFLFNAHPGELLKSAGIQPKDAPRAIDDPDKLVFELSAASHFSSLPDDASFLRAAMLVLRPHVAQSVVTDFEGRAQFTSLKPGVYYLWGVAEVGRSWAYWHLKLELQPKQHSIILDNKNASLIL
jgi:pyruvate/2-oxoglutarate dehydrogenase complex dihydrolipoamide acyltransferase (E2) component